MNERFPYHDFQVEKVVTQGHGSLIHQAEHQIEYADLLVAILRLLPTVPGMVGLSSASEILLGPGRSPRCDGLLLIRRWNDAAEGQLDAGLPYNPWLTLPKRVNEQSDKAYAIEIDRGTEAPVVIARKARDYRTVFESRWWVGKYPWPTPLWVVPDDRRREVVVREWLREWDAAPLLITTRPEVEQWRDDAPIWWVYHQGQVYRRSFIADDWRRSRLRHPDRDGAVVQGAAHAAAR